jgi:uncharacterized membrane protein
MPEEIPSELAPTQTPDVTGADPALLMGAFLVAMVFALIAVVLLLLLMRKRWAAVQTAGWGVAWCLGTLGVFTGDWWWWALSLVAGLSIISLGLLRRRSKSSKKPSRLKNAWKALREDAAAE